MACRWLRCLHLALALVCTLVVLPGCRRPAATTPPLADALDQGRFPHARHTTLACTDCHPVDAILAGTPVMPGGQPQDHAPCDRSGCHREAFQTAPGPLCAVCHEAVDPLRPGASPLLPYPPERGRRALASVFSHAQHLDYGLMERQVGFHVSCTDCHVSSTAGAPSLPGHAVCSRCHAPEAAPSGTPSMNQCSQCHDPRAKAPSRQRSFITGDLRFEHTNHQLDRRGTAILCTECHEQSASATTTGDHPTPTTLSCVRCHDDGERVPPTQRMRVCETCHSTRVQRFDSLAPRSHLPPQEKPEDHTLAFRRDHGRDAERDAARCASCHTFMSGTLQATCDECHQVMKPRDHVITWRELDHGSSAVARPDACATCHSGSFCVACHSRPPRSHVPMDLFRQGGHATYARLNLRACLTCHDPSRSSRNGPDQRGSMGCGGTGCHGSDDIMGQGQRGMLR